MIATGRAVGLALAACLALLALVPSSAAAHGLVGRLDLPVPQWLFAWAAAVVLVVSFVGLTVGWRTPRLERSPRRTVARVPALLDHALGAVGVVLFALVVFAGLFGEQAPAQNLAPTAVYVVFWVGIPILSIFVGDIFRAISPWRAIGRLLAHLRPVDARPYPAQIGRLPAAVGIVLFAWVELVAPFGDEPRIVAGLALAYAVVQILGIRRYGLEAWTTHADAFGATFSLFAAISPLEWRDRTLRLRRPLAGLADAATPIGTVALLCALIGTTSFDGASGGEIWATNAPDWYSALEDLGLPADVATSFVDTLGLAVSIGLIALLYRLGADGIASVRRGADRRRLALRFAPSLAPIAVAYLVAHYFSLLVFQGQALGFMVSDPLANGADLFGTAGAGIDLGVVSASAIWYVQAASLIVGHVAGLALAHDRALVLFKHPRDATRSQYWMLAVMVGYTCLGLWLLSSVGL